MSRNLEGKRRRQAERKAADSVAFNKRSRDYRNANPKYKKGIIDRIAQRRKASPEKYLWEKAKHRAKLSGLEFNIEVSDIVIPKRCPVLGIPIYVLSKVRDYSPNVDRIKGYKGYVKGNVMVISARANRLKSDANPKELRKLADFYEAWSEKEAKAIEAMIKKELK